MASKYTTILPTDSALTIKKKKAIELLEGQKEYSGLWNEKEEKKLQTLKNELDAGKILPTLPDTKDETEEGGGWKWLEGIKSLNPFKKDTGGESFTGTGGPDVKNIVLNLVKNYGTERAIKMATGYGIPLEAISFALSTPIGQDAAQDFNQMKSDLVGPIVGTAKNLGNVIKSAFSPNTTQPSLANQGIVSTQQGNYQAPIMTQQQMVQEAQQTGGTVNPHEVTKAVYAPSTKPKAPPGRPIHGPHWKAEGGMVQKNTLDMQRTDMDPLSLSIRQKPPPGGWGQMPWGTQLPSSIPDPGSVSPDQWGFLKNPWGYMGQTMGGFGETLGGYKEQMGGFKEQLGGFGEQLGGFKGQFENIDSRLQNMEQGITSLTDKLGVQQQSQNPFQMFGGYNPYGGGYGGYSFFKNGGEVENIPHVEEKSNLPEEVISEVEMYVPLIKEYEGHGKEVYDTEGNVIAYKNYKLGNEKNITSGYGFSDKFNRENDSVTVEQAEKDLRKNIKIKLDNAKEGIKNFESLSDNLKQHIVSSWYRGSLSGSPDTIDLINAGEFEKAANEFLNNDEYREAIKPDSKKPGVATRMEAVAEALRNEVASPNDSQKGGITNVLESLRPRMAGGGIMDYTRGGHAMGPGTGTSDSIPAFLSDGEFVMTADAVKGFGGGNRQQGAQKLYSMMKKAEAGA